MRKESTIISTVGQLRDYLKDLPDDTPIVRQTNGYNTVLKDDVSFFYGVVNAGRHDSDAFLGVEVLLVTG